MEIDFYTLLGPEQFCCARCGTVYPSGRSEWQQLSVFRRISYLLCSAALVGVIGMLGGMSLAISNYHFTDGPASEIPGHRVIGNSWYYAGFAIWGGLVALMQIYRVIRSKIRTSCEPVPPFRTTHWNLQTGLTLKLICSVFIVPIIALGAHYVLR